MIVTLRKFLEIAPDIICPYICIVHLEYEHEDWGTDTKQLFNPLKILINLMIILIMKLLVFIKNIFMESLTRSMLH